MVVEDVKDPDKRVELDVKKYFLSCKHLFNYLGALGDNRVVYEKQIVGGRVRADVMVFTENKGIIGVEFKTAPDTLKRLPRQLKYYSMVCNYVFVFCHDSHLKAVEDLIAKLGMKKYVGIITYEVFKGRIIAGLYKEAKLNPHYSLATALQMLWKTEIEYILLVTTRKTSSVLKNTFKYENMYTDLPSTANHLLQDSELSTRRGVSSKRLSKRQLVQNYIGVLGESAGTRILCLAFIYPHYNPEKYLKIYDFGDNYGKYYENK